MEMGSGLSCFNVSLILRGKVTRKCPRNTSFEEKVEPVADSNRHTRGTGPNRLSSFCFIYIYIPTDAVQFVLFVQFVLSCSYIYIYTSRLMLYSLSCLFDCLNAELLVKT